MVKRSGNGNGFMMERRKVDGTCVRGKKYGRYQRVKK